MFCFYLFFFLYFSVLLCSAYTFLLNCVMAAGSGVHDATYKSLMALSKGRLQRRCIRARLNAKGTKSALVERLLNYSRGRRSASSRDSDVSTPSGVAPVKLRKQRKKERVDGCNSVNNAPNSELTDNGAAQRANRKRTDKPCNNVKFTNISSPGPSGSQVASRRDGAGGNGVDHSGSESTDSDWVGGANRVSSRQKRGRVGGVAHSRRGGPRRGVIRSSPESFSDSGQEDIRPPTGGMGGGLRSDSYSETDTSADSGRADSVWASRRYLRPRHFRRYSRRSRRDDGINCFPFRDYTRLLPPKDSRSGQSRRYEPIPVGTDLDLPTVPDRLYGQIKSGKFVDFDSLLSALEGVKTKKGYDISLQPHSSSSGPTVQCTPRVESQHNVRDLSTWLRAWTVYLEIATYFHPHLTSGLVRYQGIITRFSTRFFYRAWIRYDVLFRQKVALHPAVPWGSEDSRLYHEILVGQEQVKSKIVSTPKASAPLICLTCQIPGHTSRVCPKRSQNV